MVVSNSYIGMYHVNKVRYIEIKKTRGLVVRRVVVSSAHQNSNPRFAICVSHKSGIFI
jgi:hypothetical protein